MRAKLGRVQYACGYGWAEVNSVDEYVGAEKSGETVTYFLRLMLAVLVAPATLIPDWLNGIKFIRA